MRDWYRDHPHAVILEKLGLSAQQIDLFMNEPEYRTFYFRAIGAFHEAHAKS